ncbi:hypothetical protein DdX_21968 [Ditylenchus destructor]|uniref:Uncharacterized protein n=1 Tax=Ditylenchus destructor TaxID=166010 RepID=A0AAD4QSS4_9BILA|nr:hypothetical protein DdX_21968 [Ditylenchus destructor]
MFVSDNVRSAFIHEFGKRFNREERKQWMAAKGYRLDVYGDLSGLRIGSEEENVWAPLQFRFTDFVNLRIHGPYKDSLCPMSLMFCSDLRRNLSTEYWAAALHFFRLIRHPSAFFRQITLIPFDFKLWEAAKWGINEAEFGNARNVASVMSEFLLISDHHCVSFRQLLLEQFEEYLEPESDPPCFWFNNKCNTDVKPRMRMTLNFFYVHFKLVLDTTNA